MAPSSLMTTLTFSVALAMLILPSISQISSSQKFKTQKEFENSVDLPNLGSTLHYTYNFSNSSLSIAYVGSPDKPEGWISWAINPTAAGMIGAQAFVAFKSASRLAVQTYDITAAGPITQSKLKFDVWDLSAESDGRNMVIFASMKVPLKAMEVNQVWQCGASVTNGVPDAHAMDSSHTSSKGVLKLNDGSGTHYYSFSTYPALPSATVVHEYSGGSGIRKLSGGWCFEIILLMGSFIGF